MYSKAINSSATRSPGGNRARPACAGFTIVELIIVLAIIMILATMAIPGLSGAVLAARNAGAVSDVRVIGQTALGFYAETGAPPNSLIDIDYDKQLDPWGRPYQYLPITDSTDTSKLRTDLLNGSINTFFELYSMGADGQTATSLAAPQSQDDIVWGDDGSYVGLASNY
jgi:general secretion pathway protein G